MADTSYANANMSCPKCGHPCSYEDYMCVNCGQVLNNTANSATDACPDSGQSNQTKQGDKVMILERAFQLLNTISGFLKQRDELQRQKTILEGDIWTITDEIITKYARVYEACGKGSALRAVKMDIYMHENNISLFGLKLCHKASRILYHHSYRQYDKLHAAQTIARLFYFTKFFANS